MSDLENIPFATCATLLKRLSDFGITEEDVAVILGSEYMTERLVTSWRELTGPPEYPDQDELQATSVRTLKLNAHVTNALLRARIHNLYDLVRLTAEELDQRPLIGPRRVQVISSALRARNLSLRR